MCVDIHPRIHVDGHLGLFLLIRSFTRGNDFSSFCSSGRSHGEMFVRVFAHPVVHTGNCLFMFLLIISFTGGTVCSCCCSSVRSQGETFVHVFALQAVRLEKRKIMFLHCELVMFSTHECKSALICASLFGAYVGLWSFDTCVAVGFQCVK